MKNKLVLVFAALAALVSPLAGQTSQNDQNQSDAILVRKSDLPPEVLKQLEAQKELAQMSQKIETYGKWVGLGKEVGVAVNDSLAALTEQSDKFAKTGVGKFTMFLVAYKVLGKDLIGVTIGIPLLCAFFIVWIWSYRKCCIQRSIPATSNKEGQMTYMIVNEDAAERGWWAFAHFAVLLLIGGLLVGQVIF